jgi:hypothetical protein
MPAALARQCWTPGESRSERSDDVNGIVAADGNIPIVTGIPRVGDRVLYQFINPRTRELVVRPATIVSVHPDTPDHRCNLQIMLDGGVDSEAFGHDAALRGLAHKRAVPEDTATGQSGTWRFDRAG